MKKILLSVLLVLILLCGTKTFVDRNVLLVEGFQNECYNGIVIYVTNTMYDVLKVLNFNKPIQDINIKDNCFLVVDTF